MFNFRKIAIIFLLISIFIINSCKTKTKNLGGSIFEDLKKMNTLTTYQKNKIINNMDDNQKRRISYAISNFTDEELTFNIKKNNDQDYIEEDEM